MSTSSSAITVDSVPSVAPKKQLLIDAFVVKSSHMAISEEATFTGQEHLNFGWSDKKDKNTIYRPCIEELKKQSKSFDVPVNVEVLELSEIPVTTNSFLTIILHENSLIPDDYVPRLMAMNNLFRQAAVFCGPVYTRSKAAPADWFVSKILQSYKNYEIDSFDTSLVCKITDEQLNYPPLYGSIISGRHYNEVGGYRSVTTPRSVLENNSQFFKSLSSLGDIIYSCRLNTSYFITAEEFELKNFSRYYYNLGYERGLVTHPDEQFDAFVPNASLLEIQNTDWVDFNETLPEYKKLIYKRQVSILKCSYELGFFEAVSGQQIA